MTNPIDKPKLTYEECDALVKAYRDDHDQEAGRLLIDAFEGYIVKFYNVIRWGKMNHGDRSLREFVKLYMKSEYSRRHIHQYKRMPTIQQDINMVCDSIKQLCSPYDDEELKNEIYVAMLTMAKRYHSKDGKPRFHHYVLQAFHYQLRRQLQTLVADPIVFRMANNINFHDSFHDDETNNMNNDDQINVIDYIPDQTKTFTIAESLDSVNENWVIGHTAGEEYKHFTIMERKIIKLYYIDEMSDHEIADVLGTCRATVNRRRNKAIKRLEVVYKKDKRIT